MTIPDFPWLRRVAPIVVVALVLRLGVAFLLPMPADFMYRSEPGWTAANLVAGNGYTFDFYGSRPEVPLVAFIPPLHPWLMALALLFPDPGLALALMQALLGALTVWLFYHLATGLAGEGAGSLAGWGSAFYPPHVLITAQPISAVLHICLLTAVLLAGWRLCRRPTIGRAALTGAVIGLFALSRPQILCFIPLLLIWLWFNRVRGRRLWRLIPAMLLVAFLIVLPWSLRNTFLFGRPTFLSTNGGVTFWNGNNPFTTGSGHDVYADKVADFLGIERDPSLPEFYEQPDPYPVPPEIEDQLATMPEIELDRAFWAASFEFIRQYPLDWIKLEGRKLVSFWWFRPNLGVNPLYRDNWTPLYRVQFASLLLLAVGGLVLSRRQWRQYLFIYATLLFYTLVHLAFHVLTRYRWEIEMLLLIFAALTLEAVWRRFARGQA